MLRSKVATSVFYLVVLAIVGIIGYKWDLLGREDYSQQGMSCYFLMAACTGLFLISGKLKLPYLTFFALNLEFGMISLIILIVKLVIAVILGMILLPFIVVWQVATIAVSVMHMKNQSAQAQAAVTDAE